MVSLCLETSDFAWLIFTDAGITTASFYRDIACACSWTVCWRRWRHWSARHGKLMGAIAGAFFALALVGFRAKGMLVLYASFAYGFILFDSVSLIRSGLVS